ncbi:MAG: hypothetical protein WAW69_00640 [Polaromonas sp.]
MDLDLPISQQVFGGAWIFIGLFLSLLNAHEARAPLARFLRTTRMTRKQQKMREQYGLVRSASPSELPPNSGFVAKIKITCGTTADLIEQNKILCQ